MLTDLPNDTYLHTAQLGFEPKLILLFYFYCTVDTAVI